MNVPSMPSAGIKRLVICLIGMALVQYIWMTGKAWIWAFTEIDQTGMGPEHRLQLALGLKVAGITALTAVNGMAFAAHTAIVLFLVTGNTAAVLSAFKFSSSAVSSAVSEAVSSVSVEKKDEQVIQEFSERYKDDPSYRPIDNPPK